MTDQEFMEAVQAAWQRAVDAGKTDAQARELAEQFRRNLSLALIRKKQSGE